MAVMLVHGVFEIGLNHDGCSMVGGQDWNLRARLLQIAVAVVVVGKWQQRVESSVHGHAE